MLAAQYRRVIINHAGKAVIVKRLCYPINLEGGVRIVDVIGDVNVCECAKKTINPANLPTRPKCFTERITMLNKKVF